MEALGAEEYFYGDGVCLVEWAERAGELLPRDRVDVALEYGGDELRKITVEAGGSWIETCGRRPHTNREGAIARIKGAGRMGSVRAH